MFSVIIVTHNQRNEIEYTLESILSISQMSCEIVIVDDASDDGTYDSLSSCYGAYDNIQYVYNDTAMGFEDSISVGQATATYALVRSLAAGDTWEHKYITELDINPYVYDLGDETVYGQFVVESYCMLLRENYAYIKHHDLRSQMLTNAWNLSSRFTNLDILENSMKYLSGDDIFFGTFLELERKRVTDKQSTARIKVGIVLNDTQITFGNGMTPENGNPGIGGTEYESLLLARYLEYVEDISVTIYHFNPSNYMPWNVRDSVARDRTHLLEQFRSNRDELLIFTFIPDSNWYRLLEQHQVNSLCWQTNYFEFYDPGLAQMVYNNPFIKQIICVSQSMYMQYAEKSILEKMNWIPNMCVTDKYIERDEAYNGYDVTYIGGLYYQKGFHVLAKAWKDIKKAVPQAKLHVIGSGRLYSDYYEMGEYGLAERDYEEEFIPYLLDDTGKIDESVIFYGNMKEDKNQVIANTSVGVANPIGMTETFCISAVEFEAAGVPVVTRRVSGVYDTVVDGETGVMVDTEEELAGAVIDMLLDRDKNNLLGHNAKQYVSRFHPDQVIPMWRDIIYSTRM